MKVELLISCVAAITMTACNNNKGKVHDLETQIDSLRDKVAQAYVPGFGEFMSSVQIHHAKLWFAGINENWELADFEVHEIEETLDAVKMYQSQRNESEKIGMLDPAMDSVTQAIQRKDLAAFRGSFILLTNTCNNCHRATDHAFNVVKVPDSPPFSNQEFGNQGTGSGD